MGGMCRLSVVVLCLVAVDLVQHLYVHENLAVWVSRNTVELPVFPLD